MMPGMATNAPDQLAPQPQDAAMSGFNGLDGGVDVRTSIPLIHMQIDLIFVLL